MSDLLLFSIGGIVFSITVVATLLYGYFALDRFDRADVSEPPLTDEATPVPAANLAGAP
ncbi:MAG: hypothetical protein JJU45_20070 [Acidimicrobiia bacterium]|nr:hypothetical protein [Acidimicrobiia bacterium]